MRLLKTPPTGQNMILGKVTSLQMIITVMLGLARKIPCCLCSARALTKAMFNPFSPTKKTPLCLKTVQSQGKSCSSPLSFSTFLEQSFHLFGVYVNVCQPNSYSVYCGLKNKPTTTLKSSCNPRPNPNPRPNGFS